MLACVPPPGDLSHRLPSHSQMNTGFQKWDTTQKMRSAQYPTPAELDAYAKKVANSPLTIKIFPNSVKVPQRKHVRRTVNGLDTAGNRYSPYPPQASAKAGLLAVVTVPFKGVLRDLGGSRARPPNPLTGHYAAQGTLTLPQVTLPQPPQGPPRAPALARQSGRSHPQTVGHQLPQALCPAQSLPHPSVLLHPPVLQGRRTAPAGEVPPNVTVSTSTIPLSMAAGLRQSRPADLSGIVHRIGQFCQARAGVGGTSMCEGRIANPSPLGCSLLVCASSRAPTHYPTPGPLLSCSLIGTAASADKPAARGPGGAVPLPSGVAGISQMPVYRDHSKPPCSWNQHHLPHLQPISEERPLRKPPSREHPGGSGFLARTAGYAPLLCTNQAFSLKPPLDKATPSPPGGVAYANGHYFQPLWSGVLPAARSQSSAPPDLALPFQVGVPVDCTLGTHYRTGAGSSSQTNAMQAVDYVIRDFQVPCFRDQSLSMMGKVPQLGGALEQADSRHPHIPGYR